MGQAQLAKIVCPRNKPTQGTGRQNRDAQSSEEATRQHDKLTLRICPVGNGDLSLVDSTDATVQEDQDVNTDSTSY